jgi:hypothetical protein
MNTSGTFTQPESDAPSNLAEAPKFTDIVIAVHGIGAQRRFETVRSVANRLAVSKALLGDSMCCPVAPQPLGYFHSDVKRLTPVSLLDDADSLKKAGLASIGFAEVFWADIPQDIVKEGRTLEETKAWAGTVVARARALCKQAKNENRPNIIPPNFNLAGEVLEEIIDTVHVLENLFLLADKAGIFHFDLAKVLEEYVGDVQLVTEFSEHRNDLLNRFQIAMEDIHARYCKSDPKVRLHIVAHSEGTVVSFLAMLHAMSGNVFVLDKTSDPRCLVTKKGEIPPWIGRIKGYMTIGSPIDKHLLLWPRLWKDLQPKLANEMFRDEQIHWRNYYDYGDPVGFKLDTARLWLHDKKCAAFEFCGCPKCKHDIGFARYMLAGEAHNEYWNDSKVFEHFINSVVRPGKQPAIVPRSKPLVALISPLLPHLFSFLLLVIGVFILYKAVNAYTHPSHDPLQKFVRFTQLGIKPAPESSPWDTLRSTLGIACLIAGGTFLARFPRLAVGPCWRRLKEARFVQRYPLLSKFGSLITWKVAGIGAFLIGGLLYFLLVPSEIRDEIGRPFGSPTIAIILITAVASMCGYLTASPAFDNQDRRQRWFLRGMRPLITCGALAIVVVIVSQIIPTSPAPEFLSEAGVAQLSENESAIIKQAHLSPDELKQVIKARGADWAATLERVLPILAPHPAVWPVLVSGIAFLYLWWLATLVFDLAFIWHRYVRNSVANDRLMEWNPYKFALYTGKGETRANIHGERDKLESAEVTI